MEKENSYLVGAGKQEGKGLSALKEFKAETGLEVKQISLMLGVPAWTIFGWLSKKKPDPPHDLLLFRAVKDMRREYAEKIVKAKVVDSPRCLRCGEEIILNEVSRGMFTVSHRCLSGAVTKIPARPKDEILYALTPIVREE